MATRAEVFITTKDGKNHKFYHHWDGHPWGVGYDLVDKILSNPEAFDSFQVLRNVMTHDFELEKIGDSHMDTEYIYKVDSDDTGISVSYQKREINGEWSLEKKIFSMAYVSDYKKYMPEFLEITR